VVVFKGVLWAREAVGKSFEGREDIRDIFCYRSIKAELAAAWVSTSGLRPDSQAPRPQDYLCFRGVEKETLRDFCEGCWSLWIMCSMRSIMPLIGILRIPTLF
jgi:hypothetical protein